MSGYGVLLADDDCGFCRRAVGCLLAVGIRAEVGSIQRADLTSLGVDPVRAWREIPWVSSAGEVTYGARAIGAALASSDRASVRLVGALVGNPPMLWVADPVYRWGAAHRHRLPGGTPACRI